MNDETPPPQLPPKMRDRVKSLMAYHVDLARLACNKNTNVFWVLDLTDARAMELAATFDRPEKLVAVRDNAIANNKIPASTIRSGFAGYNSYRVDVAKLLPMSPPPEGSIYVVIITEGRITTIGTANFATAAGLNLASVVDFTQPPTESKT